jgi:hypothetical protein
LWKFSSQNEATISTIDQAQAQGSNQEGEESTDSTTKPTLRHSPMNSSPRFTPRQKSYLTNSPGSSTSSASTTFNRANSLTVATATTTTSTDQQHNERSALTTTNGNSRNLAATTAVVKTSDLGLWDQLKTPDFFFILVFASVSRKKKRK